MDMTTEQKLLREIKEGVERGMTASQADTIIALLRVQNELLGKLAKGGK